MGRLPRCPACRACELGDIHDGYPERPGYWVCVGCGHQWSKAAPPRPIHGETIQARFERFHQHNPVVYTILVRLAREFIAKRTGHQCGIGMLWEVVRWNCYLTIDDPNSEFKLCNDYRSRYARLMMAQEPDLQDTFELRTLRRL